MSFVRLNLHSRFSRIASGLNSSQSFFAPLAIHELQTRCFSSGKDKMPVNKLGEFYSATTQPDNGEVYDKKPFKMTLVAGKTYSWCLCGKSRNQPLCDGTHKDIFLKIKLRPIRFEVTKTKEYWLCNCKHTKHRPFCDGTHKTEEIQKTPTRV